MLITSLNASMSPCENEVWFFESNDCKELVIVSNRHDVLFQAIYIASGGVKKYTEKTWEVLVNRLKSESSQEFWRIQDLDDSGFPLLYNNL